MEEHSATSSDVPPTTPPFSSLSNKFVPHLIYPNLVVPEQNGRVDMSVTWVYERAHVAFFAKKLRSS